MREKELKIKALEDSDGQSTFEGWLSTYENTDRDGDKIEKGAFAASVEKKATVPLCFNHDRNRVIGKLELADMDEGLYVVGTLNTKDPSVASIESLIKMGALDSMSIGMGIQEYEPIDAKRPFGGWIIKQAEVYEGSVVTVPANEMARIESMKELSEKERNELLSLRTEKRLERVNELIKQAQGLLEK